jgi:hypothetical protein
MNLIKKREMQTTNINEPIVKSVVFPLCACGCGNRVSKFTNKYIHGHYWGGKVGPNKNKKLSDETKQKIV